MLGLPDQPAAAEQRVARDQCHAGHDRERRQPLEHAARVSPALDPETLDEAAEHQALGHGREQRAVVERLVPEMTAGARLEAELEGDAAQDERDQHDQERQVGAREDHRIGEREGAEQGRPAEHQPGLVAVPDRRHRGHHQIAVLIARGVAEEDADPEVEAVEQHVHHHGERDDPGPGQGQIDAEIAHRRQPAGPAADSGRAARPWASAAGARGCGPRCTSRIM